MDPALRALMSGLIDYAGLFPPAKLAMDDAVANYLAYRDGEYRDFLGRFIVTAARLGELAPLLPEGDPIDLSVIVSGERDDFETLQGFLEAHGERAVLGAIEAKLPPMVLDFAHPSAVEGWFYNTFAPCLELEIPRCAVSLEAGFPEGWRQRTGAVIRGLGRLHDDDDPVPLGLKIRCGGLEPAAFPSPEQVAFAVLECREAGVPFKATAGLHHPLRHENAEAGTHMHGFLNLFGIAILTSVHDPDEDEIAVVLADEDPTHFTFRDGSFYWTEHPATAEEVAQYRRTRATSFGSCSFTEPIEDLNALGLL